MAPSAAIQPVPAPAPAGQAGPGTVTPAMRAAAREFESLLVGQLLQGLTEGLAGSDVGGSGLGGGGDDPFAGMLQDEYARLIARSGGIGLGDAVLRQMLKLLEAR